MKRDDFGMRIDNVRELATKYSKPELANMVRMGMVSPQEALMAGMMIDRIAKSAMQPPTTTVAEDVLSPPMGAGIMGAPQAPPPSAGVAGLPSGIQNMAGGGIVAFADGGDIPGYAGDKESLVDSRRDPAMHIDPREQKRRDMEWRLPILLQELKEAQSKGRDEDVAALRREIRSFVPAPTAESGLTALIPSAQAAEKPRAASTPTKAAAPTGDYYQDPLGAPDYTTEGYSLKQPVEKGKPYEPSLQGALFGYEQVPPRQTLPPIEAPRKNVGGNPLAPTKEERAEIAAPAEEKAPMGPRRPTLSDQLGNYSGESIEVPQEKNLKSIISEQAEADKAYGANPQKMFDDIRAEYKKSQGDIKDRRDKAAGMALAMWGLGIMGARKGQEFEVASKTGQQALNNYANAMDKINDNEDKLKQHLQDLSVAENQFKVSRSDKALSELQSNKREIRAIELENAKLKSHAIIESKKLAVDIFKNENPALYQTLENIASEQRAKGNKGYTALDALKDYQGVSKTGEVSADKAKQEWAKDPMIQSKFPNADDYVRFVTGSAGGGGGGSFNYVPGKGLVPNK